MEAAKSSVKNFMSKSGKHDTTIHENVAPAVQNETISQTQHEHQTPAVNREVHQDHYHTAEQPISHSEVLPEQHHHRAADVEHRSFEHDDADKIQRSLGDERAKYRDTQTRVEGEKTRSEAPIVQGEHVHHHVHETIQPVVHKQTVEPHVVHTTVPIHEVHHNEAHHHAASTLPPMSMDDFKNQGGALGGRETQTSFKQGEPQSLHGRDVHDSRGHGAGTTDHSGADGRTKNALSDRIGTDSRTQPITHADRDAYGANSTKDPATTAAQTASAKSGEKVGTDGRLPGSSNQTSSLRSGDTTSTKPSLMDKLNPKKDADGDGKAGFMK